MSSHPVGGSFSDLGGVWVGGVIVVYVPYITDNGNGTFSSDMVGVAERRPPLVPQPNKVLVVPFRYLQAKSPPFLEVILRVASSLPSINQQSAPLCYNYVRAKPQAIPRFPESQTGANLFAFDGRILEGHGMCLLRLRSRRDPNQIAEA